MHSMRNGLWAASAIAVSTLLTAAGAGVAISSRGHSRPTSSPASPQPAAHDAPSADPTVFPGHPRLIIGGYRGVSVADVRTACQRPDLRAQCDQIGGRHILDDAMRYVVFEDRAAAGRVATEIRGWTGCNAATVGSEHSDGGGFALAYDWVWETLTTDERGTVESKLVNCSRAIQTMLEGNGPHLWHGFTPLAASLALMALVVDRQPGGATPMAAAVRLFRGTALEAYAVVGGAWPEGYNYERSHFFSADPPNQYVMDALRAWDSAVERDHPDHASLFETIAEEEGDWLRGLGYHFVYGTLDAYGPNGKRTLLRGGDMPTGQAWPNKQYRPFVDSIARVYRDGVLARWGRDLEEDWAFVGGDGTYHSIHRYSLPFNLPLDVATEAPGDRLPRGRIWGRADLGFAITRSGWAEGETTVAYRAGKWFTGHQHMDQGHVDIWRKGPLAVDSGVYAAWGSEHREAYYMRTVAHNTLLILREGEDFDEHPGAGIDVNDGGQRVHTYNPRGCAQCMQSVAEWRANVGAGLHFEAGRVDAFEDSSDGTVIASDLTAAYNSVDYATPGNVAKVASVQRDLVFVRPSLLLITDRVVTVGDSRPPRFVLHFPVRPEFIGLPVFVPENGILEGPARPFQVDNGTGGRLIVRTLAPAGTRMSTLGGPDFRYWTESHLLDGRNRTGGAAPHEGPPAEPGLWRVEISPTASRAGGEDHLLVHALTITDTVPGAAPVSVSLLDVTTDPAVAPEVLAVRQSGVRLDRTIVQSAAVPRERVRFAAFALGQAPRAALFLTDLVPGADYRVCLNTCEAPVARGIASGEGVLRIEIEGRDRVAVGQCPPADGAGDLWRRLCGVLPEVTVPATPTGIAQATSTPTAPPEGTATPTVDAGVDGVYLPDLRREGR